MNYLTITNHIMLMYHLERGVVKEGLLGTKRERGENRVGDRDKVIMRLFGDIMSKLYVQYDYVYRP